MNDEASGNKSTSSKQQVQPANAKSSDDAKIASIYFGKKDFKRYLYLQQMNVFLLMGKRERLRLRVLKEKKNKEDKGGCLDKLKLKLLGKKDEKTNYDMELRLLEKKFATSIIPGIDRNLEMLKKKVEGNEVNPATQAFVTFRSQEGKNLCLKALPNGHMEASLKACCSKPVKVGKNAIVATEASDPTLVNWPNLGIGFWSRVGRYAFCSIVLVLSLFFTLFLIEIITAAIEKNSMPKVECKKIGSVSP